MLKKLVLPIVVVVAVLVAGFWWFVLRDDAPKKLSVGGDSDTSTTLGQVPESLDGSWSIVKGSDSTAGFRIKESFAGGLADHEAVGRSSSVTGAITIAGTKVTEGQFTVDLTALEFSDDPGLPVANRVRALQQRGLQTAQFPEASFKLTEPIDFGEKPQAGKTVDADATGELTLHGVTKEITFPVQAVLNGNAIVLATDPDHLPEIVLADYDIEPPTGGPVASVEGTGTFEFKVTVTQL